MYREEGAFSQPPHLKITEPGESEKERKIPLISEEGWRRSLEKWGNRGPIRGVIATAFMVVFVCGRIVLWSNFFATAVSVLAFTWAGINRTRFEPVVMMILIGVGIFFQLPLLFYFVSMCANVFSSSKETTDAQVDKEIDKTMANAKQIEEPLMAAAIIILIFVPLAGCFILRAP